MSTVARSIRTFNSSKLALLKKNSAILMPNLQSILIDLSGTLHIENDVTPGATDALKRLRQTGFNIKFVTNTTKESRRSLHERLINLGFQINVDEIYSSLWATRDFLKKEGLKPMLMVDDDALEDFSGVTSNNGDPNAVVVGLAPKHFNRPTLNKAFRILLDGGRLIAINEARYYKRKDGLALGAGPFVKILEYGSGKKSLVVGKPSTEFFQGALNGVAPEQAVMIGDDVKDDIGGAQKLGIRGYLVKTGKYISGDENKIDPPPFKCVECFSEAVDDIISTFAEKKVFK